MDALSTLGGLLLNRTGFARSFVHPELAYLGMVVICTGLIGLYVIPVRGAAGVGSGHALPDRG